MRQRRRSPWLRPLQIRQTRRPTRLHRLRRHPAVALPPAPTQAPRHGSTRALDTRACRNPMPSRVPKARRCLGIRDGRGACGRTVSGLALQNSSIAWTNRGLVASAQDRSESAQLDAQRPLCGEEGCRRASPEKWGAIQIIPRRLSVRYSLVAGTDGRAGMLSIGGSRRLPLTKLPATKLVAPDRRLCDAAQRRAREASPRVNAGCLEAPRLVHLGVWEERSSPG